MKDGRWKMGDGRWETGDGWWKRNLSAGERRHSDYSFEQYVPETFTKKFLEIKRPNCEVRPFPLYCALSITKKSTTYSLFTLYFLNGTF
jgi:hypothetical protein